MKCPAVAVVVGAALMTIATSMMSAAQADDVARAGTTLGSLESLLEWPAPEPTLATDVRVMTRSPLAFVPLPLIRLTSSDDSQVVASVTEWQARDQDPPPVGRAFVFAHPPVACTHADDRALCAGVPQEMRGPEVKALWFALLIARSCNDHPRANRSDAEDLFARGRLNGMRLQFSCRGPSFKSASPGDRQAAAVLRIAHRLLGR